MLREALTKTNKAGVAKVIIRTKESLSLILPHQHTLLLYLIHFKEEIVQEEELNIPHESIKSYKISDKEIKMAVDLIKDMTAMWEPEKYHNEYQETMHKWLAEQTAKLKKGKKKTPIKTVKEPDSVVDFITLLKESMRKKKTVKRQS